jgi:hypothetical protein
MSGAVQFPQMKRFRRWVFNGLAALSLVLCLATCVLWVRSYFVPEVYNWTDVTNVGWGRLRGPDDLLSAPAGIPREFRIYGNAIMLPYALVALLTALLPLAWLLELLRAWHRRRQPIHKP